uniref:Ig-like domain-containing protein n=1 Tax=Macrostomum lignano TaxID=282301 RepID=A0A1I8FGF4_9PLAT
VLAGEEVRPLLSWFEAGQRDPAAPCRRPQDKMSIASASPKTETDSAESASAATERTKTSDVVKPWPS